MMSSKQFLPLCDLLFNIISLACYFCDLVFDLTTSYALHQKGENIWAGLILFFCCLSLIASQIVSLCWASKRNFWTVVVHLFGLGVLWRYFKLFLPVDLSRVKLEVRDLCVLRLLHAFAQSAPLLLVELHLLLNEDLGDELRDLNLVSVLLSLFSVCWALASFSKNVRTRNVHKLVLTWLGVIFQFTWRLGTVGTRAMCLVLYASLYGPWVLLVVLLHWVSMFLWIVSTGSLFKVDEPSTLSRTCLSSLIAFVYVLAYINLQEAGRHKHKMVIYYLVMTLENSLLCFAWYLTAPVTPQNSVTPAILASAYTGGIVFMLLYYRYFHVRRLNYQSGGRMNMPQELQNGNGLVENGVTKGDIEAINGVNGGLDVGMTVPHLTQISPNGLGGGCGLTNGDLGSLVGSTNLYVTTGGGGSVVGNGLNGGDDSQQVRNNGQSKNGRYRYYGGLAHNHHGGIPGVFNCRFTNPYTAAVSKRKKKKPTSFVPPPSILPSQHCPIPFWCRPLASSSNDDRPSTASHSNQYNSGTCSSGDGRLPRNHSRATPVADIRAKLEAKKRQQLAELRNIEEEMRRNAGNGYPQELTPAYLRTESRTVPYTLPRQNRHYTRRSRKQQTHAVSVPPSTDTSTTHSSAYPPSLAVHHRRGGGGSGGGGGGGGSGVAGHHLYPHSPTLGDHVNSSDGDVDSCDGDDMENDDNSNSGCWWRHAAVVTAGSGGGFRFNSRFRHETKL